MVRQIAVVSAVEELQGAVTRFAEAISYARIIPCTGACITTRRTVPQNWGHEFEHLLSGCGRLKAGTKPVLSMLLVARFGDLMTDGILKAAAVHFEPDSVFLGMLSAETPTNAVEALSRLPGIHGIAWGSNPDSLGTSLASLQSEVCTPSHIERFGAKPGEPRIAIQGSSGVALIRA